MEAKKFNILLDGLWGSSGKGKVSAWLSDSFKVKNVSSSNFPNAGHTFQKGDYKFVAKVIPTALALKGSLGFDITGWMSPASGIPVSEDLSWDRLIEEWLETGKPYINIHSRASIVTKEHARQEFDGPNSVKHIASTMQGCSASMIEKILRKKDCMLSGSKSAKEWCDKSSIKFDIEEFTDKVKIIDGQLFRKHVQNTINNGDTWLHEGSQGYALSIDHGSHFPACTSRNCTSQKAMDDMAIAPHMVGDIYLNLRTFPIRVGNVVENGNVVGHSGGFYPDCEETSWEQVAEKAGMPPDFASQLVNNERTTVTKRIRRVCTFSWIGLKDSVDSNGATKLILNFVQYLNWKDHKLRGGLEAFKNLSKETRSFIDKIESESNCPVVMVGTGADHDDMISLI